MKRSVSVLSDISRIVFTSAIFCSFFSFFALVSEQENAMISPFVPVLGFLLVFAAGRLLREKELILLKYTGIEIIIIAAGLLIIQLLADVPRDAFTFRFLISLCFVTAAGICAKAALSENSIGNIVHRFDVCILLFIVALLAEHYLDIRSLSTAMIMIFAAFIFLLLTVVVMRTEKNGTRGSRGGMIISVVAFAVVIGIALLIGIFGREGAGGAAAAVSAGIKAVFGAISAVLSFIWKQWMRFCLWLESLFEPGEAVPIENTENTIVPDMPEPAEFSRSSIIVFYILTALAAAAVLTAIVLALRKIRIRRRQTMRGNSRTAERSGDLRGPLKDTLDRFRTWISYQICCVRYRNTPAGLLIWCEKKNLSKNRRMPSESGPQFLKRLSETCSETDRDALIRLAGLVEKAFYSPESSAADESLCRAVRSCRF